MKNLTLRQLRYFDALARLGHFGRAADICSVSQPALSVQIKELEAHLGLPLFDRGARGVRLTAFGEDFVQRVRVILRGVDELGDLARAAGDGLSGRLRLGIIPTIAPYLLPRIIPALTRDYPSVEFQVRETLTARLIAELHEGNIDAALVALPVSETGLREKPLFDEDFVLVRAENEAAEPVPDGEALQKMRLLLLEEGHCFRDQALTFCKMPARVPTGGLEGSSLATLVQMVGAGIGVTLVPEIALPVEARSARVSLARFPAPGPRRSVGMIWRASSPLGGHLEALSSIIQAAGLAVLGEARGLSPPRPAR